MFGVAVLVCIANNEINSRGNEGINYCSQRRFSLIVNGDDENVGLLHVQAVAGQKAPRLTMIYSTLDSI